MRNLLLILLLLPILAQADVYKWRDAQGRVHYGDRPVEGAERMDVRRHEPSEQAAERPAPAAGTAGGRSTRASTSGTGAAYGRVEIRRPANDETFRNATGRIPVQLALEPSLRPGHQVQLLLDGAAFGEPVAASSFQLTGVERGSHRLAAVVLDGEGEAVGRSDVVSFQYHKPSVAGEERNDAGNAPPSPMPGTPDPGAGRPRPAPPMGGRGPMQ